MDDDLKIGLTLHNSHCLDNPSTVLEGPVVKGLSG
jgi:hypothetical protein